MYLFKYWNLLKGARRANCPPSMYDSNDASRVGSVETTIGIQPILLHGVLKKLKVDAST